MTNAQQSALISQWIDEAEADFAGKPIDELERLEDKCAMNGVMLRKRSKDNTLDPTERFVLYRDSLRCEVRTRIAVYLQKDDSTIPLDKDWRIGLFEDILNRFEIVN